MSKLKTLLFAFAAVVAVAVFQSCDEETNLCDGISVPAGCTCTDGVIDCEEVVVDPCENVVCRPGFTCDGGSCVNGTEIIVNGAAGELTGEVTWTSDKVWVLDGKVVVGDGATLTIQAGTIVKGFTGEGSLASALVVARGGKLMAMGTAAAPIIMTSYLDDITIGQTKGSNLIERDDNNEIEAIAAGKWGGLIVLGKAPISVDGDAETARIEGLLASESYSLYGGTDAADNSGTIEYVSVRHGGAFLGEGNEINGITFGGVGNGTTVNHIEVVGNLDDGVEYFGGSVNSSNVLVWSQGDDAYDVDQAYSGTIDNFVYIAGDNSDHGFEIDGPEGTATGTAVFTAGSMKGLMAEYADFRDGALANVTNVYWFNFDANDDGDEFELDDDATSANYFSGALVLTGMEFNTTLTADKLFDDKADNGNDAGFQTQMAADNSIVTAATGNVGANTSVFGWTLASEEGALDF